MKRLKLILPAVLLVLLVLFFLTRSSGNDRNAPRFISVQAQVSGHFGFENYDWGAPVPFRDGKVWIFTVLSRSNHHEFLYDIDNRKIVGELLKGGFALANKDRTKLLCSGEPFTSGTVRDRFFAFLNRASLGKLKLQTNRVDCYWFLDAKNNSARPAGTLSQLAGTGSTWAPSPGFRFGFNVPNNSEEGRSFFLCDLETYSFRKIKFNGKLYNWWSDHQILASDPTDNFLLFDVLTGKTVPLFTIDALSKYCRDFGVPTNSLHPLSCWNGSNFDYYFSDAHHWGDKNGSFLLKADKAGPSLRMFSRNLKFHWLGRIHENGQYYVYSGESGAPGRGGNGAVYVRDLKANREWAAVPPNNSGQYSLARFYANDIIYCSNRVLWRTDLYGSNTVRLFAPDSAK